MQTAKMHIDEVETSVSLVRRLLASQFPLWADLPVTPIASAGTDNAIYRLGDKMSIRLPRIHWAVDQIEKEHQWMPKLAPHLPLALPVPIAQGMPGEGYPWNWSVYKWQEGENAINAPPADMHQTALDLAKFLTKLQQIDTAGAPPAINKSRGLSLKIRDAETRESIAALEGMYDGGILTAIWEQSLAAPEWNRSPVWFHGDMMPGNLLVKDGRLSAVIDFSNLAVGDPSCDFMIAWHIFSGQSRETFRKALAVDDASWTRSRGRAISQAVIFIPYYLKTNPIGVKVARHALDELIADYKRAA